ncbi:pogo transposable element with KRAB domain [Octopus vulgaris]|uniref:Pogo transposable element with KRAB domain n=1 Tax=Octopus vulgaris TaxID=6645 RepID=A0AA36EZS9_OCTVU|nr:pogo transposable element with KRAB domain [Octopus vulgaris]
MNSFSCSDKWIFNFVKRNELTVRKITHVGQADNKTLGEEAQIASDYLDSIPVLTADKDADQIYKMDETPVYVDMLSSTTIDFVGNKNVDVSHCGTTKSRFTAVLCVNAAGKVLKTMIIFKGLKNVPKIKVPKNIYLTVSNRGSITYEFMQLWADKVFGQRTAQLWHAQNSVLFMNECSVHKKTELLEVFKRNNTILKLILPKTTSYLQPLDVSIIGPFKKALRAEWENWFSNGKKEYTNKGYRKKTFFSRDSELCGPSCCHFKYRNYKACF